MPTFGICRHQLLIRIWCKWALDDYRGSPVFIESYAAMPNKV